MSRVSYVRGSRRAEFVKRGLVSSTVKPCRLVKGPDGVWREGAWIVD